MPDVGKVTLFLTANATQFNRVTRNVMTRMQKVQKSLNDVALGAGVAFAAIGLAARKAVGQIAKFGAQMARVQAISSSTAEQTKVLEQTAIDLAKTTQFTASEAAKAYNVLAMAGFDANKMLGAIKPTLDLAAAGAVSLEEAANIVTSTLAGFGKSTAELAQVNDVLASSITGAKVNVSTLGQALKLVGPIANASGVSFENTASALSVLGNFGVDASLAGTGLRRALVNLQAPTAAVLDGIEKLGANFKDSEGNLKDFTGIVRELERTGAGVEDLASIFGIRGLAAIQPLLEAGSGALEQFDKRLDDASGTAKRMTDSAMRTLQGRINSMNASLEGLVLSFRSAFEPGLKRAANAVGAFADKLSTLAPWVKSTIVSIGAATIAITGTIVAIAGVSKLVGVLVAALGPLVGMLGGIARAALAASKVVVLAFAGMVKAAVAASVAMAAASANAIRAAIASSAALLPAINSMAIATVATYKAMGLAAINMARSAVMSVGLIIPALTRMAMAAVVSAATMSMAFLDAAKAMIPSLAGTATAASVATKSMMLSFSNLAKSAALAAKSAVMAFGRMAKAAGAAALAGLKVLFPLVVLLGTIAAAVAGVVLIIQSARKAWLFYRDSIVKAFDSAKQSMSEFWNGFVSSTKTAVDTSLKSISSFWDDITKSGDSAAKKLMSMFIDLAQNILGMFKGAGAAISTIFKNIAKGQFKGTFADATKSFTKELEAAKKEAAAMQIELQASGVDAGAFKGLAKAAGEIGKEAGEGLDKAFDMAKGAAADVGEGLKESFDSVSEIATDLGIVDALKEGAEFVKKTLKPVFDKLGGISIFETSVSKLTTATVGTAGKQDARAIALEIQSAEDKISADELLRANAQIAADMAASMKRELAESRQRRETVGKAAGSAVGGPVGGMISGFSVNAITGIMSAISAFVQASKPLQRLFSLINGIFQEFVNAFDGLLIGLSPVITLVRAVLRPLFAALAKVLSPFGEILANVIGAFAPLFQLIGTLISVSLVFSLLEPVLDGLAKIIEKIARFIFDIFNALAEAWNGIVAAITGILRKLGDVKIFGKRPLGILRDWADKIEDSGTVDLMNWKDATDTAALASEGLAATLNGAADAALNVPQILKLAQHRFDAIEGEDSDIGKAISNAANGPPAGNTTVVENVTVVEPVDMEEFTNEVQRAAFDASADVSVDQASLPNRVEATNGPDGQEVNSAAITQQALNAGVAIPVLGI